MGLNKNFKVRVPKCPINKKHQKPFGVRLQIDALMITKKNKLRRIIMRRLTVFWKLFMFWAVIGFSENFTVKAPKCDYHEENKITR